MRSAPGQERPSALLDTDAATNGAPSWRTFPRIARALIIGGLTFSSILVLFVIDGLAGAMYRTSTATKVHVTLSRSGVAEQAVVVFPGYIMPGEQLSQAFAPFLGADDAMVVAQYAERGVDMDGLYSQIMAALDVIRPKSIRLYGASMGGMCAKQFLDRYAQGGSAFGRAVLVLDTAPDSAARIKRPGWVFGLASWYRGGPLASLGWAALNQFGDQPTPEQGADQRIVSASRRQSTWVGMPALTSQADYLAAFPTLLDGELVGRAERVVYLHGRDESIHGRSNG